MVVRSVVIIIYAVMAYRLGVCIRYIAGIQIRIYTYIMYLTYIQRAAWKRTTAREGEGAVEKKKMRRERRTLQ